MPQPGTLSASVPCTWEAKFVHEEKQKFTGKSTIQHSEGSRFALPKSDYNDTMTMHTLAEIWTWEWMHMKHTRFGQIRMVTFCTMSVLSLQVWLTPYLRLATPRFDQEHYTYVTGWSKSFWRLPNALGGYSTYRRSSTLKDLPMDEIYKLNFLGFLNYNLKSHINWVGMSSVFLLGRSEVFEASDVEQVH